jgi:exopolysaccharide biosynthesis polyprenyl glycosylphosphotransferase
MSGGRLAATRKRGAREVGAVRVIAPAAAPAVAPAAVPADEAAPPRPAARQPAQPAATPAAAPPIPASHWRGRYQLAAVAVDFAAAVLAVVGAFFMRFGNEMDQVRPAHLVTLVVLPLAWLAGLGLNRAYEVRCLGAGAVEFERLGKAFLQLTAVTAFTTFATHADLSRGFILLALPATLLLSACARYALRTVVHRARRTGGATASVLAVGGMAEIGAFTDNLVRNEHAGLHVTAACLSSHRHASAEEQEMLARRGIALVGDIDTIRDAVLETGVSTVAVIANHITGEQLRWISWQLEGTDTDLVLLPALTEVAGRRLSITQVGALPFLYMAEPELKGVRRAVKGCFDRAAALLGIIALLPVLVLVGLAIRLTSRGPALFLQTRVGKNGKTFRMVKFRSMVLGAEARIETLHGLNEADGGTLFKIRCDPRVTRVGRFLRRFSIDELPQLFNVLTGSMSLVGPRPPLPQEVATYGGDVRRRLLVKPGMTGLWQISGRSDLTWEESVRIDLRYVENWSLALDAFVLAKTVRAVLRADGAY